MAALVAAALVVAACAVEEPTPDPETVEAGPDDPAPAPDDGADTDPEPDEPDQDEPAPGPSSDDQPADASDDAPDLSVALDLDLVVELTSPIAADVGPDGVLYVASRAGTVHPIVDGQVGEAVVDLSAETTTDSERGLLGLAFAAEGDELFLSFTDRQGATRLDAVAVDENGPDPSARRTLLELTQPYANHNGGHVVVGPDGMLYLGLGDGGSAGDPLDNGQDLSTKLGALLRIDPTGDPYEVPADNPFVDAEGAAPEIVAYGLRNPWRFAFDEPTDRVFVADVGQDAREEINVVTMDELFGANFGWNLLEGTLEFAGPPPDDHVPPVYEYDTRGPEGCAVTGGVVYRGEAIPELLGAYLYSDSCIGTIRALALDEDGEVAEQVGLGIDGGTVVGFAQDPDGEVLVLDLGGTVSRIVPAGS